MPQARATEPVSFYIGHVEASFAEGDLVDGDVATLVLSRTDLPFVEVADESTPVAKKKPAAKKTAAPADE
jgi:hypothetical protein